MDHAHHHLDARDPQSTAAANIARGLVPDQSVFGRTRKGAVPTTGQLLLMIHLLRQKLIFERIPTHRRSVVDRGVGRHPQGALMASGDEVRPQDGRATTLSLGLPRQDDMVDYPGLLHGQGQSLGHPNRFEEGATQQLGHGLQPQSSPHPPTLMGKTEDLVPDPQTLQPQMLEAKDTPDGVAVFLAEQTDKKK